jgi:signal transduction histidine kinase/ActR/RegA family two-component response regulator
MPKWSRQYTLRTGLIVIGLLAILGSVFSILASGTLVQEMAVLGTREIRDLSDSKTLQLIGVREVSDANAALLTGEPPYAPAARAGSAALRDRLARLQARIADTETRILLDRVQVAERAFQEAFEQALRATGAPGTAAAATVRSRGQVLEQALDGFVTRMEPAAAGALETARASVRRTRTGFALITSVSIVLTLILCGMLFVLINRTYREQLGARRLAQKVQTSTTAALQEEKAASHLKDEFLATVSHELRNPLAPILTWTQLLRSGTLEKEKFDRGLEVIERNVVSLSQLIDDLVDVARVASGKFRLDVRPIDLAPVIRAAVDAQRPASDAKQIRLQLVLDERSGLISGDSERLQQVMGNLLSNAVKFTPKGGSVQVTLGRAESHVEMGVSDSGIGMDAGFLPHIFEPFQQAGDGSRRRHSGLGLGLSIVRHIVELHGGEISAESPGPGGGSRFTVKLPLLGTGQLPGAARPAHPRVSDGLTDVAFRRLDEVRVLLVDDEPTANEALQTLLDSCGAEVRIAGSAAEALKTLDVWKPDVLISDIAMPEEDGYALIRSIRLRNQEKGGQVPAAALTAYGKIEDRVNILAAGFQMYLSKPADPSELIAVVASLAGRRIHAGAAGPDASSGSG